MALFEFARRSRPVGTLAEEAAVEGTDARGSGSTSSEAPIDKFNLTITEFDRTYIVQEICEDK